MGNFQQDLRYAFRTLLRSPGYTLAALASLGLGIGANTAIFTLANALFLHPLPVREPSRLLELYTVDRATQSTVANITRTGISLPNTADIALQNGVFSGVAAYVQAGVTMSGSGKPTQENAFAVSGGYFDVLGVHLEAGRAFDHQSGFEGPARPEVVLSHSLAQRLFGGASNALGKTLNLNSVAYSVIGVAPADFAGTLSVGPTDPMWLPLKMHSQFFGGAFERLYNERRFRFLNVFARLKPGESEERALSNLRTIAGRLETAYPRDNRGRSFETSPIADAAVGFAPRDQAVSASLALGAAVALVLLIACANLANLSLARAAKRGREMGVRVALGAGRGRLAGQLLAEAALLSLGGGLLGIAVGSVGARFLWAQRPGFLTQTHLDLGLDPAVTLFTVGLTVLSCLLAGVLPVFQTSMPNLSAILNGSGRGNVEGSGRSPLRRMLVVGEIALSLVALVVAGLFVRSMQSAQNLDLGFEPDNLVVTFFNLGSMQMPESNGREFMRSVVEKVKSVPGVTNVALSSNGPLGGGLIMTAFHEGDPVTDPKLGVLTHTPAVSPDFFDTMKIPVVEGRAFNVYDKVGSTRVAVVSQAFAKRFWPGQKAVGKRIRFGTIPEPIQVVGVVKDHVVANVGEVPQSVAYMPFDQAYQSFAILMVRTASSPQTFVQPIVGAAQTLNPELAFLNPGTVRQAIAQALWAPKLAAGLFGLFGLLALTLAVIGVYGVTTYMVTQRTSEIGVRVALGAEPSNVVAMVLGQSMQMAVVGIVIGIAGALSVTRMVGSLLYVVSPTDPATFAVVSAILIATAVLAGGVPAVRAARMDPVRALRQE